ncbi:MAG: radical SAM protein [Candidatus Aureabacteria bacterium]|nr:radical SAM protein [Candidatus Auribacterota bacterium]
MSSTKPVKIIYIRPPRHYWPILNEADNFLLPLAYPTLAAYVRQQLPHVQNIILDCCAHQIGWRSLKLFLEKENPDIVAIGEKVCYSHEADKAFRLVKEVNPHITTVAGGQFYSHVVEPSLRSNPCIDYILRFEGEIALVEFIKAFENGKNYSTVPNLAYLDKGKLIQNEIAPLLDMTSLPPPAYDISSLDKYQPFGKLWPKAVTVQRSRGCTNNCSYCSWIAQESVYTTGDNNKSARKAVFRSKTPQQMIKEIEMLYEQFGVRYLFWVDASWNYGDDWMNEFCDEIIRRKYKLGWWAFIRLDLISEQHQNGTLKKMVRAGFRHILAGADRNDFDDLCTLGKRSQNFQVVKEALGIFKKHYPEVFRQCTFITGLPDDTSERIQSLLHYAHEIDVDFAAFHPLSPFPGTPMYEEAQENGLLMDRNFVNFDMFYPVMKTKYLTQEEVAYWTRWCQSNFVAKKPFRYFWRFFSPHSIRRRLHWWFAFAITRVMVKQIVNHIRGIEAFQGFSGVNKLWKPAWYET